MKYSDVKCKVINFAQYFQTSPLLPFLPITFVLVSYCLSSSMPLLQTHEELPKEASWPTSPLLTALGRRLREAVKGNKILIQQVWANTTI